MDSTMDFTVDGTDAPIKQKITVSGRTKTILIGNAANPALIAITFCDDGSVKVDLDNSTGQFNSLVTVADHVVGTTLSFDAKSIQINPDLTINLDLKNPALRGLRIRPDEILRVDSAGNTTPLLKEPALFQLDLPTDLFEHKDKIKNFTAFPSQLNDSSSSFVGGKGDAFPIPSDSLPLYASVINGDIYISDGDFLRKCDKDGIKISISPNKNAIQFTFNGYNKIVKDISDENFNNLLAHIGVDPSDPKLIFTPPETVKDDNKLSPLKFHTYKKSEKNPEGTIERFDEEQSDLELEKLRQEEKEKKEKEKDNPKKDKDPKDKDKPSEKEETIDLSYPLKLVGFALFFLGFFGGPFIAMILGICIGGSGYAFNSALEDFKFPSGNKRKTKKEKEKKEKKEKDKEQTKKDLIKDRVQKLTVAKEKLQNNLDAMQTEYNKQLAIYNNLLAKFSTIPEDKKDAYLALLGNLRANLTLMQNNLNDYRTKNTLYQTLIDESISKLNVCSETADVDKEDAKKIYEESFNKLDQENRVLAELRQKRQEKIDTLAATTDPDKRTILTNEIEGLRVRIEAQENTCNILTAQTQNARNVLETVETGEIIYQAHMEGGEFYQNIANGADILRGYAQNFTTASNQNREQISTNNESLDLGVDMSM